MVLNADAGSIIRDYQQKDPAAYLGFTALVNTLARIEADHHGALEHLSQDDVKTFYREELSVGAGATTTLRGHSAPRSGKQ